MVSFTKREQIVILIFVVIIAIIVGFNIFHNKEISILADEVNSEDIATPVSEIEEVNEGVLEEIETVEKVREIMVHISGQVNKPGLVILTEGSRVIDAVKKAEDLTEEADIDRINLAKKLLDEEKIYIPAKGEVIDDIQTSIVYNDNSGSNTKNNEGRIDINKATKQELETLSGIGDVLADRIIEYREIELFIKIEDIMNVSGIGEKKFESIKDQITTNN